MKQKLLCIFMLLISSCIFAQNTKVIDSPNGSVISNIGGTDIPYSSSILDIRSSTKGVLLPRVGSDLASPTEGLLYYNTTGHNFRYYDGTAWQNALFGNQWNVNGTNISYSLGNVGIGTTAPAAQLAVNGSVMVDQANASDGFLTGNSLYFGSDKKVGILRSFLFGSSGKNGLSFFTNNTRRMTIDSTGQVGIGTINPLQSLHVVGNTYLSGFLGIGNTSPDYAFENLYGYNYMYYGLGIGTAPNSTYLLDVGTGATRFQGDVRVNGILNPNNQLNIGNNTAIEGSLTVNNAKGVAYNPASATNLRVYPFTTATFTAILGGFELSAEGAIVFGGNFTSVPKVFVGDEDLSGGSAGELHRVELKLYGCKLEANGNSSCKARLLNTSPNPVNYTITWNCVAIGN